ncbi:MAG: alanine--tRNA ligase, partial [Candidatus Kapaibacteriales bacterium]
MTSLEIRKSFLDFFASKDHQIVPSSPVIPQGDPTLLFTNAGMNQFKDVFLGIGTRSYKRAVDTQKCIRVSGKHNDLEEVGVDTFHHTFFEMLGNWSFGDYYKAEAIEWAWELLTKVWGLPKDRLFATVYLDDDESFEYWKRFLPEGRIFRFDAKDNFWEMGEVGPCGPCSEIHFDRTSDKSGASLINTGNPNVIEIWNLVFIQYNRKEDGSLEPLPAKHVDTGMGLERVTAILQGQNSNYDTDLFRPLISEIEKISGKEYPKDVSHPDGISMRVIADHVRTLSFAIADGVFPSNEGRGYVLRRLLRRASRFSRQLGVTEPVIYRLIPTLIKIMGNYFTELIEHQTIIEKIIKSEEESFLKTLDRGIDKFEQIVQKQKQKNSNIISGDDAFQLYDTFGFPLDLTQLIAREISFVVDTAGFEQRMSEQRERSRQSSKIARFEIITPSLNFTTKFVGYTEFEVNSKIHFVEDNKIIVEETPFYVESGGQVSDTGFIEIQGERFEVVDLAKVGDSIIHFCDKPIPYSAGEIAHLAINKKLRRDTMRNHSVTHLLHEALYRILGSHVKQAGSLVAPDYLRFDFNHFQKLTDSELKEIEALVNEKIFEQLPVTAEFMSLEEAKKTRAKMFFGEKYGNIVRVITMAGFSQELCGGTHVQNTGEIGIFKIRSEQSIAAGVRRIEAITGRGVYNFISDLNIALENERKKRDELVEQIKKLEKEISIYEKIKLREEIQSWIRNSKVYNSIKILIKKIENKNLDSLLHYADEVR